MPAWIQGGWHRDGRSIGGRPMKEVSDVWWLQVGPYFADVRRPLGLITCGAPSVLDAAQAFSGRITRDGRQFTWRHDLDSLGRPPGYLDCAEMHPDDGHLVERGPGYVEMWRLEVPVESSAVLEKRHSTTGHLSARVVMVGDLTLAVWGGTEAGGAALRFDRESGGWSIDAEIGAGAIPWAAVAAVRSSRPVPGWHKVA